MSESADFSGLRVNLGLVLNGSVSTLQKLPTEIEAQPGVKVVYVKTSGSRLRVTEEEVPR